MINSHRNDVYKTIRPENRANTAKNGGRPITSNKLNQRQMITPLENNIPNNIDSDMITLNNFSNNRTNNINIIKDNFNGNFLPHGINPKQIRG